MGDVWCMRNGRTWGQMWTKVGDQRSDGDDHLVNWSHCRAGPGWWWRPVLMTELLVGEFVARTALGSEIGLVRSAKASCGLWRGRHTHTHTGAMESRDSVGYRSLDRGPRNCFGTKRFGGPDDGRCCVQCPAIPFTGSSSEHTLKNTHTHTQQVQLVCAHVHPCPLRRWNSIRAARMDSYRLTGFLPGFTGFDLVGCWISTGFIEFFFAATES